MSSDADEQYTSRMWICFLVYKHKHHSGLSLNVGIVDGNFLPILLRLYRLVYAQPLTCSIISPIKQTLF